MCSLSTFRVGLSTSSNSILKLPYRHVQKFVSIVILDLIELTIKITHHSYFKCHCRIYCPDKDVDIPKGCVTLTIAHISNENI